MDRTGPITALLERLLRWLERRQGCFVLREPVVVQHGSAWLRIAPGEQPRWFDSGNMTMEYTGG